MGIYVWGTGCGASELIEAVLEPGAKAQLRSAARELYPELQIEVHASVCQPSDRPMYPGKRHVMLE